MEELARLCVVFSTSIGVCILILVQGLRFSVVGEIHVCGEKGYFFPRLDDQVDFEVSGGFRVYGSGFSTL